MVEVTNLDARLETPIEVFRIHRFHVLFLVDPMWGWTEANMNRERNDRSGTNSGMRLLLRYKYLQCRKNELSNEFELTVTEFPVFKINSVI